MHSREDVRDTVERFYDELPFNATSASAAATRIAAHDQLRGYPDLEEVLTRRADASVVDLGCGTGWFALTLAFHHGIAPTAVDLSRSSLDLARATAAELGVEDRVNFVHADLFKFAEACPITFDVVSTIGVLHHTGAVHAGLRAASRLTAPGGYLHVGLYHTHGRLPFLELFDGLDAGDAFALYRSLQDGVGDEELLRSWFRDQVLHPHETQHTLAEIDAVLEPAHMELCSTSLTRFSRPVDKERIFADEPRQRELSVRRNVEEGTYFPGFFTALYRREEA